MPELITQHGSAAQAGNFYADFVRQELNAKISQGADVEIIQCLLLIGMYEWGAGSGFNAWMYTGKQGAVSWLRGQGLTVGSRNGNPYVSSAETQSRSHHFQCPHWHRIGNNPPGDSGPYNMVMLHYGSFIKLWEGSTDNF